MRFRRGELEEAERLGAEILDLVKETESRIIRLWLGPLYVQVLLALSERAGAERASEKATSKRTEAADQLARYTEFVAGCQSPRFKGEAVRLAALLQN